MPEINDSQPPPSHAQIEGDSSGVPSQRHGLWQKEVVGGGGVKTSTPLSRHFAAWQKGRIAKQYVNYPGQNGAEPEPLALIDVRFSPELTVTLDDLVRARKNKDPELERSAMR